MCEKNSVGARKAQKHNYIRPLISIADNLIKYKL